MNGLNKHMGKLVYIMGFFFFQLKDKVKRKALIFVKIELPLPWKVLKV